MKTKWMVFVAVAAFAGILSYAGLSAVAADKADKLQIGGKAPDFALEDPFGKTFTLSEFKNKVVVLEWLNQGCPVSKGKHKAQVMQDAYKQFAAKDVVWLAIDSTYNQKPDKNRIYAAEMGLAYPVLHDADGKVGKAYGAKTTPHMFVIGKAGKLLYDGAIDDQAQTNYVTEALKSVLAGKPIAKSKTRPYGCSIKYAPAK